MKKVDKNIPFITEKIDEISNKITEEMLEKKGIKKIQLMKGKDLCPRLITDDLIIDGEDKIIEFLKKLY